MTKFDPPSDPYGDEVHCPICDAVMEEEAIGSVGIGWVCKQYHEDELISQEDYLKKGNCPVCDSFSYDILEPCIDYAPKFVDIVYVCKVCKATWKEVYKLDRYEMVGTK